MTRTGGRIPDAAAQGGILLVDKPAGKTSFAIVDQVRRVLAQTLAADPEPTLPGGSAPLADPPVAARRRPRVKCGHAGSLDPIATGLLILMYGRGTRLSPFLMGLDKSYTASMRFGVSTDTLDVAGQPTEVRSVTCSPRDLEKLLPRFLGDQKQVPPAYSAIKWQGQPLYKRARRGETLPPLQPRPIHIQRLEILDYQWGASKATEGLAAPDGLVYEMTLAIECSSGTYVRALARDLAIALGTVGYVKSLRRDRVGPFQLADALRSDCLADPTRMRDILIPLGRSLPHLPRLHLSDQEARCVRQGQQPEVNWLNRIEPAANSGRDDPSHFVMLDPAGELVAVCTLGGAGGGPSSAAVFPTTRGKAGPCV